MGINDIESADVTALPLSKMDPRGDLELRVGTKRTGQKEDGEPPRRYLVCSRTLARVSPVFQRMLYGSFAEARKLADGDGDWVVELGEDKPPAMEVFLAISHGHLHRAPPALGARALYDLTMLTHYYDATHLLMPWIRPWVGALHDPASMPNDAMARMVWISWELGHHQMFEATVRRITMEGRGAMFAEDSVLRCLHMPSDIIERICAVRDETIDALLDVFRSFIEILNVLDVRPPVVSTRHVHWAPPPRVDDPGVMMFCLTRASLWPIPEDPSEIDYSILGLYEMLSNLVIHDIGLPILGEGDHQGCNPQAYLVDHMKEVLANMESPLREDDRDNMMAQAKKLQMI